MLRAWRCLGRRDGRDARPPDGRGCPADGATGSALGRWAGALYSVCGKGSSSTSAKGPAADRGRGRGPRCRMPRTACRGPAGVVAEADRRQQLIRSSRDRDSVHAAPTAAEPTHRPFDTGRQGDVLASLRSVSHGSGGLGDQSVHLQRPARASPVPEPSRERLAAAAVRVGSGEGPQQGGPPEAARADQADERPARSSAGRGRAEWGEVVQAVMTGPFRPAAVRPAPAGSACGTGVLDR